MHRAAEDAANTEEEDFQVEPVLLVIVLLLPLFNRKPESIRYRSCARFYNISELYAQL